MFACCRAILCLSLLAGLAAPVLGGDAANKDAAKQEKAAKRAKGAQNRSVLKVPKEITLTTEQQTQLKTIQDELSPKANEVQAKLDGILTAEQKAARAEAMKAAKSAGKTRQEARAAVDAAVQLSEEQKKQMAEAQAAMRALQQEFRTKLEGILTAEQKAQLPKRGQKRAKGEKA